MASDLWIELAEAMISILKRIEAQEKEEDEIIDVLVICMTCGVNEKECVCF